MKCNYCGSELPIDSQFCGNCGAKTEINTTVNTNSSQPETVVAERVNNNVNDKGSFGWAVLGFIFPLVGLILYLCWKDNKPNSAKMAGTGALVRFCLNLVSNFFY